MLRCKQLKSNTRHIFFLSRENEITKHGVMLSLRKIAAAIFGNFFGNFLHYDNLANFFLQFLMFLCNLLLFSTHHRDRLFFLIYKKIINF